MTTSSSSTASPLGRAFFANVGQTQREGMNARLAYKTDLWSAHATYSYTQATFQTGYVESGGSNPAQDADGNLTIKPGDRLPGVPANKLNFAADVTPIAGLSVGVDGVWQGGQYLFGDEANLTPKLPPFFVMNLHGSYQLTKFPAALRERPECDRCALLHLRHILADQFGVSGAGAERHQSRAATACRHRSPGMAGCG